MQRLKTYSLTASGILILSTAISMTGLGQAAASAVKAGVQKVVVSSGKVSVSGTVSVGNTPSVKIDSAGNAVESIPAAPAQPVTFSTVVQLTSQAGTDKKTAYTVPAGKELVIEYVSADHQQQASDEFAQPGFQVANGPVFFVPVFNEVGRGSGYDFHYVGSEQVRVYATAGQTVQAVAQHDIVIALPASVFVSFSGYLVDAS